MQVGSRRKGEQSWDLLRAVEEWEPNTRQEGSISYQEP